MSGYDYSDVLNDEFEDRQTGGGLRKLLEDALAENKKLSGRLDQLERKGSTETMLKEKGIDPAVAGMIPADADPEEWLSKFGHLVGGNKLDKENAQVAEPEVQVAPDPDVEAEQAARARMEQGAGTGSASVQNQDPLAQLNSIQTEAEMLAFLDRQRGGTGGGSGLF